MKLPPLLAIVQLAHHNPNHNLHVVLTEQRQGQIVSDRNQRPSYRKIRTSYRQVPILNNEDDLVSGHVFHARIQKTVRLCQVGLLLRAY